RGAGWIEDSVQRNDGIIFRDGLIRGRGKIGFRFTRFGMNIDNLDVAGTRTGRDLLKYELVGTGDFKKREILRRGSNENQIIIFCVIQGEQAAALDANLL